MPLLPVMLTGVIGSVQTSVVLLIIGGGIEVLSTAVAGFVPF